jgi:parvulin-like peptidyl-prolyl isomerase
MAGTDFAASLSGAANVCRHRGAGIVATFLAGLLLVGPSQLAAQDAPLGSQDRAKQEKVEQEKKTPAGKAKAKGKDKKPLPEQDDDAAVFISLGKHSRIPVYAGEVWLYVRKLMGRNVEAADIEPRVLAQVLEDAIRRQVVALRLADEGYELAQSEIDATFEAFEKKLGEDRIDMAKYLAANGLTRASLQKQLAWDSAWSKYVRAKIEPESVAEYFERHRREFDGTELRVSHILLRLETPLGKEAPDSESLESARKKAADLRMQIVDGTLAFTEAAKLHSDGPSREQGGDLGFIPRHGRMVESFSAAAFDLDKDELSQPVLSPFGIHLILCTEVNPGQKTADDVRDQISQILAQRLFFQIVAETRQNAKIEFANVLPHFDPETGGIVLPSQPVREPPAVDPQSPK